MNIATAICTLTGADDATQAEDLFRLSAEFPFVEWGILYNENLQGTGRYPSFSWIKALCSQMRSHPNAQFALHVCGQAVDDFLLEIGNVCRTATYFGRIQINFVASNYDPAIVIDTIQRNADKIIITQHNEANEGLWKTLSSIPNHVVLFDASGGRGISPESWPAPLPNKTCGYAGGLGPDNLEHELPRIRLAAGQHAYWIDMEGKLRNELDQFELTQVRHCLAIYKQSIQA